MPANPPAKQSYQTLLKAVKTVLVSGLQAAERALEYERVKTYWGLGEAILQSEGSEFPLNAALYRRISADVKDALGLELTLDTIRRAVQFRKTYPVFPKNTTLTFTHYLTLMRVSDPKKRRQLEQQAAREDWTVPHLKHYLSAQKKPALLKRTAAALPLERGELYIYTLRPETDLSGGKTWEVDCGFKIRVLIGTLGVKMGDIRARRSRYVKSVPKGEGYHVTLATRKRAGLYTYAASLRKVIDGDTLDACIDVGFGIRTSQRFRLNGINAPEAASGAGQEAKAFLTKYLKRCPVIVVRTFKTGIYGRWLADVFALPGEANSKIVAAKGEYVNQLLLDRGLAVPYRPGE